MSLKVHFTLGYGENGNISITDSMYIGEVATDKDGKEIEYVSINDSFSDKIMLRDEKTHIIEKFLSEFISVSSKIEFPSETARFLFHVSDKDTKEEMQEELNNVVKDDKFVPTIQTLQVNGEKIKLIPFVSASHMFTELVISGVQKESGRYNMAEIVTTVVERVFTSTDIILKNLWRLYTQTAEMIATQVDNVVDMDVSLIRQDMDIIRNSCLLQDVSDYLNNLTGYNLGMFQHVIDLRYSDVGQVHSMILDCMKAEFGTYIIFQIDGEDSVPKLSSATIDILSGRVMDFVQGDYSNNGVMIIPSKLNMSDGTSRIFFKGGLRYIMYYTPTVITPPTTIELEDINVTREINSATNSYKYNGTNLINANNITIVRKSSNTNEFVELSLTNN